MELVEDILTFIYAWTMEIEIPPVEPPYHMMHAGHHDGQLPFAWKCQRVDRGTFMVMSLNMTIKEFACQPLLSDRLGKIILEIY